MCKHIFCLCRLFVCITSLEPLTVYMYKQFYLRVAVAKYNEDLAATKDDDTIHQITGALLTLCTNK